MAISLTPTSATLASEYAATSISVTRQMVTNASGFLVPQFSASINYTRQDYVVDRNGNKLNFIQRNPASGPMGVPGLIGQQPGVSDTYQGYINLMPDALASLAAEVPTVPLLDAIADAADFLIHQDLVTRGIITE